MTTLSTLCIYGKLECADWIITNIVSVSYNKIQWHGILILWQRKKDNMMISKLYFVAIDMFFKLFLYQLLLVISFGYEVIL